MSTKQDTAHRMRAPLIRSVTAPLGFFVLALLIVETFLATVLVGTGRSFEEAKPGVWAGIGLFVLVTIAVSLLVWFKPKNLLYDKDAHHKLDQLRERVQTVENTIDKHPFFVYGLAPFCVRWLLFHMEANNDYAIKLSLMAEALNHLGTQASLLKQLEVFNSQHGWFTILDGTIRLSDSGKKEFLPYKEMTVLRFM